MARIRYIKPQFFRNEDLAEIEPLARLLFIGLWCIADREGRLEDRPRRIKGELFPFEAVDVNRLLEALCQYGFIQRYEANNNNKFIQIVNFSKHQYPHKLEAKSIIPAPEKTDSSTIQEPVKHEENPPVKWITDNGKPVLSPYTNKPTIRNVSLQRKPLTPDFVERMVQQFPNIDVSQQKDRFYEHYESVGWKSNGRLPIKDEKAAFSKWLHRIKPSESTDEPYTDLGDRYERGKKMIAKEAG